LRDREADSQVFKKGAHHVYSWTMNNRWGTNYRAYQEGLVEFRYVLRPFEKSDPADATRFATGFDQPLLVTQAPEQTASNFTLPQLDSMDVMITAAKPSDDGRALIFRLFGASGKEQKVVLHWPGRHPARLFLSNTSEEPLSKIKDKMTMAGYEVVTLRAEFN
jgi:alpha-mannosidase